MTTVRRTCRTGENLVAKLSLAFRSASCSPASAKCPPEIRAGSQTWQTNSTGACTADFRGCQVEWRHNWTSSSSEKSNWKPLPSWPTGVGFHAGRLQERPSTATTYPISLLDGIDVSQSVRTPTYYLTPGQRKYSWPAGSNEPVCFGSGEQKQISALHVLLPRFGVIHRARLTVV